MEPEVLSKIEKVDPVAAVEAAEGDAIAEGQNSSVYEARHDEYDHEDDEDDISLLEELLNGEDETYGHIRGEVHHYAMDIGTYTCY